MAEETPAQRKAREDAERAARAKAAADSARDSGHDAEASMFDALAEWVEDT